MKISLNSLKLLTSLLLILYCKFVNSEQYRSTYWEIYDNEISAIESKIEQILPGYKLLSNDEYIQDEKKLLNFMSKDELERRQKRKYLGLLIGNFNKDNYEDFAAIVINHNNYLDKNIGNSNIRLYSSRLVICLGGKKVNKFVCDILPTNKGNYINLPYWIELHLIKGNGSYIQCGSSEHHTKVYYPENWNGKRPKTGMEEAESTKIKMDYDVIDESEIGSAAGRSLFRTKNGLYLDCSDKD